MARAQGGLLAIGTNLAYPICDLALLGLLVGALAVGEWRLNRKLVLLGAAVFAFWIADSSYLVSIATGRTAERLVQRALVPLPVLAAWAGWVPARVAATTAARGVSVRGIVMLLGFAVTALVVLCASSFVRVGPVAIGLAALAILVILARLVMTWQENVGLLELQSTGGDHRCADWSAESASAHGGPPNTHRRSDRRPSTGVSAVRPRRL